MPNFTVPVMYVLTSNCDDELKFYKKDCTFHKVMVGDFKARIGPP